MNNRLMNALDELNKRLKVRKISLKVLICGAFAIELHGFQRIEETVDIDTHEKINKVITQLIKEIAVEMNLKEKWLNSQVSDIPLPNGHAGRLMEIRRWSNIETLVLSIEDLVCMKVYAWYTRGNETTKDYEDLLAMNATKNNIEMGISYAMQTAEYEKLPEKFKRQFDEVASELRSKFK